MSSILGMTRPPVGFGPGSQPEEGEEDLEYMPMPSGMRTYDHHLPEVNDPAVARAANDLLERLLEALRIWKPSDEIRLALDGVAAPVLAALNEALGEGEVAVMVRRHDSRMEIQEAALAGVWRVRSFDTPDTDIPSRETVLVGAFPRVAISRAFPAATAAAYAIATTPPEPITGLMNAPSILTEVLERAQAWREGTPVHAINFSLLPHTPEDMTFIEAQIGVGATTILSRGYGNCRATATNVPNVWWVRYYNSTDILILDTMEVTDIPSVVVAAPEDIADSAERLGDILEALREAATPAGASA